MEIQISAKYLRSLKKFVRNNQQNSDNIKKALNQFKSNISHSSLNVEKLGGTNIWTIRIDKSNRIFFIWQKETVILVDIGEHDKYRKY